MDIEQSIECLKLKIKKDNSIIQGMFGDIYEEIRKDNKAIETLITVYEKQQKEIEARLEEIDSLYKMMSAKDDEIEQIKEAYQILKDDIEGHRIAYVDTPEFEEKYISKDKIRDIIFEFIPQTNHEAKLRTKIIKLLGE